jgi:hypothetical protein
MSPALTPLRVCQWDDLRIVPIRSDLIASRFRHPGRVSPEETRGLSSTCHGVGPGMVLFDGFSLDNGGPIW